MLMNLKTRLFTDYAVLLCREMICHHAADVRAERMTDAGDVLDPASDVC